LVDAYKPETIVLLHDLSDGWPFLLGIRTEGAKIGHVVVVMGATFRLLPPQGFLGRANDNPYLVVLERLEVFDPLPGQGYRSMYADSIRRSVNSTIRLNRDPVRAN
jgi:hypothetical protein